MNEVLDPPNGNGEDEDQEPSEDVFDAPDAEETVDVVPPDVVEGEDGS